MEIRRAKSIITYILRNAPGSITGSLLSTILLIALIALASPTLSEDADIPHIWSQARHFTWTGQTSNPERIAVTIDGSPLPYDSVSYRLYDGTLHITIPLTYGEKKLITVKDGGDDIFRAEVLSLSTTEADFAPEDFKFSPFHTEKKESPCRVCHEMTVKVSDTLPGGRSGAICYSCHRRDFPATRVSQHRAAGIDWDCLQCHAAEPVESAITKGLLVKYSVPEGDSAAELCYGCHKESEEKFSGYEYVHGPVSMSVCNACHDPHGADRKGLIRRDIVSICVECHGMEDIMEQPVIHRPIKEKGCPACHNPHGNNFSYMLDADINAVCTNCHKKIQENNHPVNNHPTFGGGYGGNENRTFRCTSCHDPHSSEFRYLISKAEVSEFCLTCHR
jgi:predicted CXXCH cytochrome family protein